MEDFLGVIFGAIFLIAIVIATLVFLLAMFAQICANLIVAVDKLLGAMTPTMPALSWGINGFVIFSLLYFAFQEAHRLNHPNVRPATLWALVIWLGIQVAL
ncbi:MAG: hypothetical protein P9E67_09900 [Candidatus Competibacter sp.]|nr:hypothetical protein [Candidatus Competibacter sp.]